GHYTYAEVPFGNWARDAFHLARNHYDRLGHFAQGFVPAIVAREILIRRNVVRARGWLYFIVVAICLAISAAYDLLDWRVSLATTPREKLPTHGSSTMRIASSSSTAPCSTRPMILVCVRTARTKMMAAKM